ncbi:D-alanyl-D-alanine carboxypeptidase [Caloramator sp. E03]|uniref:D-alanyl-D-alanine carboxypeptidase family protein n=1 Tax=Caloramator sp. E03 TaxID=2576307 RepID=UPI001110CB74|nr:serine hydrolase [Caloramator sp. E03]QCX33214.1 D-alanyl-D-alanine carboxypeptidase [Caloramator sp. E03]
MHKRIWSFILISVLVFTILFDNYALAANKNINLNAKAVYAATIDGKVIYSYNADKQLGIASTSKIMTYLLSRELMKKHNIKSTTQIIPKITKMPNDAVTIPLSSKKKVSLSSLLSTMMAISANNSAEALRYYFSSIEKKDFITLMNNKAKSLNMKNTNFINASGITENGKYNKSTARSMYLLARETILKYPEVLQYTNKQYIVFENKKLPTTFSSLLSTGIDGLKTGYTAAAGNCIVATATIKINNKSKRVIIVILGAQSSNQRKSDLIKLLALAKEFVKKNYSKT